MMKLLGMGKYILPTVVMVSQDKNLHVKLANLHTLNTCSFIVYKRNKAFFFNKKNHGVSRGTPVPQVML